jgi:hypothetical protein
MMSATTSSTTFAAAASPLQLGQEGRHFYSLVIVFHDNLSMYHSQCNALKGWFPSLFHGRSHLISEITYQWLSQQDKANSSVAFLILS